MYSEISFLLLDDRGQTTDWFHRPSSVFCHPKVGFPIRKSADQSFFAAPRGLSQRSTSFIASQRQGIHRMPLGHLIALIINAHPARQRKRSSVQANGSIARTLNRKTSLLRIVP